jgi:hypothetical protein
MITDTLLNTRFDGDVLTAGSDAEQLKADFECRISERSASSQ